MGERERYVLQREMMASVTVLMEYSDLFAVSPSICYLRENCHYRGSASRAEFFKFRGGQEIPMALCVC